CTDGWKLNAGLAFSRVRNGLPSDPSPTGWPSSWKSPQPELNKRMSRVPGETWIIRAQVLKWRVNLMRWLFFIWVTC
ncbi:hypothetical protein GOODEAATRI_015568, partial [Goodea atripinnis]